MIYNLRIRALGHGPGIELTEVEYRNTVAVLERVDNARDMEEKLDVLLENFVEYERDLLQLGLQHSLFPNRDDEVFATGRQIVNRRVLNLLSAARTYVDHAHSNYCRLFTSLSVDRLQELFSTEYDSHLEYRIAETLRNVVQHRAFPVHAMTWGSNWEDMDTPHRRIKSTVVPKLSLEQMIEAGGFKASVLRELEDRGVASLSLTHILRQYMESLARVHLQVRATISGSLDQDHNLLVATLERALREFGPDILGLVVSRGPTAHETLDFKYVGDRSWNRREDLVLKNSLLGNLSRRYVSAEHPGPIA